MYVMYGKVRVATLHRPESFENHHSRKWYIQAPESSPPTEMSSNNNKNLSRDWRWRSLQQDLVDLTSFVFFCSVTTWQRRTLALLIVHIMVRNRSNDSFISTWLEKFAETRCKVGHVGVLLPTGGFCWLIIDWRSCSILLQPACDRKSKRYFPQMLPFPQAPLDWDV